MQEICETRNLYYLGIIPKHIGLIYKYNWYKLYLLGVEEITRCGIKSQSIFYDGRNGLLQLFRDIHSII